MKWKKLGLVFDVARRPASEVGLDFAQSPQALITDDGVRVYFSTRRRDPQGKYLSDIAFVDFSADMSAIRGLSSAPVIGLGRRGCFDEHGIFPMNVVPHGGVIHAYTCGWSRRVSVPVETAIGLAVSRDGGRTFERQGDGPVLSAALHEPFLVGDPFVAVFGDVWHMWYIFGTRWISDDAAEGCPARIYKVAHATSSDGVRWVRDGRICIADRLGESECQALPTVIRIGDRYHMYFCYRYATDFRTNKTRGYRLGYAYSEDLQTWTRDDVRGGMECGPDGAWDSDMMCYPHLFRSGASVYLLYNGNAFGRHGFGLARLEHP